MAAVAAASKSDITARLRRRSTSSEEMSELESTGSFRNSLQAEVIEDTRSAACGADPRLARFLDPGSPESVIVSDDRVLRFLRGNKFDVAAAIEQLRTMLVWRVDSDIGVPPEESHGTVTPNLAGFPKLDQCQRLVPSLFLYDRHDKLGRPIFVDRMGASDPSLLSSGSVTIPDLEEYLVRVMEHRLQFLRERSRPPESWFDSCPSLI